MWSSPLNGLVLYRPAAMPPERERSAPWAWALLVVTSRGDASWRPAAMRSVTCDDAGLAMHAPRDHSCSRRWQAVPILRRRFCFIRARRYEVCNELYRVHAGEVPAT